MRSRNLTLSAFYVSNVEDYLFRGGVFDKYMENMKLLPRTPRSVVIRSVFGRGARPRNAVPGYYSASSVQNLNEMVSAHAAGTYASYYDLIGD